MTLKQNEALKEEAENFLYVDFREPVWFFWRKNWQTPEVDTEQQLDAQTLNRSGFGLW